MQHELLDAHQKIAWDMDHTLIKGPNSTYFRNYIIAHPQKEHHVVTFRTGAWAQQTYNELFALGVSPHLITGVHACPDELYFAYATRHSGMIPEEMIDAYLCWKGLKASELGCTILVDDMEAMVRMGCERHGVVFVDSHDLAFGHHDEIADPEERDW